MQRARQPTPVFLPGESHEQRNLAGYSPWGHKESYMTERLTLSTFNFQDGMSSSNSLISSVSPYLKWVCLRPMQDRGERNIHNLGAFQENQCLVHDVTEHVICWHAMCQTQTQRNREREA